MDVYVVMHEYRDGEPCMCYGVFMTKDLAENKIMEDIATKCTEGFTFIRDEDRWVLEHGEREYRIETHKLEGLTVTKSAQRRS